ncbi:D-alanine--D-alanine ligase [Sphingobacterium sp. lm-10]|uniref:D-alanine--D-alanine ligase n=1 Tax=Sphingobacterium sp. lm-10 TaxID=2944904 RepID=UPI0020210B51|nr:D-alanine--D-alanine ligase [Sphingobacterium sp. lm-10]MCL7989330.1 D-alanine--D-alanine ligase [Sphingobacterium sp. lm-10]
MKTKVALITGGYTEEAEVSFKSSAFVHSKLDAERYEVYPISIMRDQWFYVSESGMKVDVNRHNFSITVEEHIITFDVAFIVLHGSPGEDGRLQGYFDMIGLPYTSCDALTSALTMNKGYTKAVLSGIPAMHLADSVLLFAGDRQTAAQQVKEKLSLPFFVKPNAGGSSIGMTKVKTLEELDAAIAKAYDAAHTGQQVLVEEFIEGREFSRGIFRNEQGDLVVLPATEVITTREFFDYEAKYIPGLTEEITPADLTEEQNVLSAQIIREVYRKLNCRGMVRVDFFLQTQTENFYFIEINTTPGQTAQSFIPQQVRAFGMTETSFYSQIIEVALQAAKANCLEK